MSVIPLYPQKIKEAKLLRKSGSTYEKIAKFLRISETCVFTHCRDYVDQRRKYSVDETFFNTINDENKAYLLGLILADGCVTDKKLSIGLKASDSAIVVRMKKIMGFTGPVSFRSNGVGKLAEMHIFSRKICESLRKYGVVPNKTYVGFNLPRLRKKLMRHFIRGYFDGDGTFFHDHRWRKTLYFGFIGKMGFIKQLQEYLVDNLEITKTKPQKHNSDIVIIQNGKVADVVNFIEYIYKDASLYLDRKRERAFIWIERLNKMANSKGLKCKQ